MLGVGPLHAESGRGRTRYAVGVGRYELPSAPCDAYAHYQSIGGRLCCAVIRTCDNSSPFTKAKEVDRASRLLERLRHPRHEAPEWERVIALQSEVLLNAAQRGPANVDDVLAGWERETRRALGIFH